MLSVEEKLRRLQPFVEKKKLSGLWKMYLVADGIREKKEIEGMMDLLFDQKAGLGFEERIILSPPERGEAVGELGLGKVKYCGKELYDFGIRKEELIKHVGLFGQTGSGKTTACMNLLAQLVRERVPFMIFDWKRNYRDLLTHPRFANEEIFVFTVGRAISPFYFNPKTGPGSVEVHVWKKKLMEIIEKAYLLGPGAADVLMDAMDYPTFAEMKEYVDGQKRRGREMLWHMSGRRALNSICFPGLSEVVNCEAPTPFATLLGKNVILELDGLSDTDKTFIIGSLLLWIYYFRLGQPEREVLKHVVIVEEAHHLLLRTGIKEDITDVIMREVRELGEGLVVLDQHPHKISTSALGNCFTLVGFSTTLSQDAVALANSMVLEKEQRKYFGMLTLGEAIVKTGRRAFPFQVSVPPFSVRKGSTSDEMIRDRMANVSATEARTGVIQEKTATFQSQKKTEELSPPGAILLEDISVNPLLSVRTRYKRLGINPREGNQIQESLLAKDLIRPVWVDKHTKLLELTPQGIEVLEKYGLKKGKGLSRGGGVEHNYFVDRIEKLFAEKGGKAFLEQEGIDLVVETPDSKTGIQVETGKSDIKKSIEELSRMKADQKFLVATNAKTKEKIGSILAGQKSYDGITVVLAQDFLTNPSFMVTEKNSGKS